MITFLDYLTEEQEIGDLTEEELDEMVEELSWEDIADLYDEDELVDDEEDLSEAISATSRLRRGMKMKSRKTQISLARKMKLRRVSNLDTLKKRARLAARRSIMKRFLKGRSKGSLSVAEKNRIENQIKNMGPLVNALSAKMLPKVRSLEQKRLSSKPKVKILKGKTAVRKK